MQVGDATCSLEPPQILPLPICLPSCGLNTPLLTEWGYDDSQPNDASVNPIFCSDPDLPPGGSSNSDTGITPSDTPGQSFFLANSTQSDFVPKPGLAWTNFNIQECNVNPACNVPNKDEVLPFITGQQSTPPICGENICTTNGTIFPLVDELDDVFEQKRSDFTVGTETINGWEVFVPVVSTLSCGVAQQVCPGDPGGRPYLVEQFARVYVTDIIQTGQKGFRIIGFDNPRRETFTFSCKEGGSIVQRSMDRLVTSIDCANCADPTLFQDFFKPKLVQ
jgi:hypothetical protein